MSMTATDFKAPASDAKLDELAANLRSRNFDVVVVQTGAEASADVLRRRPRRPDQMRLARPSEGRVAARFLPGAVLLEQVPQGAA